MIGHDLMMQLGILLVIFGFGSLILPEIGFQFRLMELLDDAQPVAGIIVGVIGLALVGFAVVQNQKKHKASSTGQWAGNGQWAGSSPSAPQTSAPGAQPAWGQPAPQTGNQPAWGQPAAGPQTGSHTPWGGQPPSGPQAPGALHAPGQPAFGGPAQPPTQNPPWAARPAPQHGAPPAQQYGVPQPGQQFQPQRPQEGPGVEQR